MQNRPGSALLSTLIIIAIIGASAVGAAQIARFDTENANRGEEGDLALAAARAGIEDGLLRYRFNPDIEVPSGQFGYDSALFLGPAAVRTPACGTGSSSTNVSNYTNATIPTSQTPFYERVFLHSVNAASSGTGGITATSGIPQWISAGIDRSCLDATYLTALSALADPRDYFYDLKISYREPSVGQVPVKSSSVPCGLSAPAAMTDAVLTTYLNCVYSSNPSSATQASLLTELQNNLHAIKVPKDQSIDISFPSIWTANSSGTLQLVPVAYQNLFFTWEATAPPTPPPPQDPVIPTYGLDVIDIYGPNQTRNQYTVVNGGNPPPGIAANSQNSNLFALFSGNSTPVANGISSGSLPTNSQLIPLKSSTNPGVGNSPEHVRFRAIGTDIWLLAWADTAGAPVQPLQARLDTGQTVIESIGQVGTTQRKLTATIDRTNKRLVDAADFVLFTSAGGLCLQDNCN